MDSSSWQDLVGTPALQAAVVPRLTKYIPHRPTPKQTAFLLLNGTLEVFFGGAAGGGKSDALLMAALQYVDVPGYSAMLFRRTYTDLALPMALLDRAHQWLKSTDARWVDADRTYRFPSGASLSFGYLEHEGDKYRYQSAEFQFIGFDEATQFTETQYSFLFSRLRRTMSTSVPLRMRCASNPGNIGHEWVRRRFIDPATREGRVFIPSSLKDNPHIDRDAYVQSLMELDPLTRAQMLDGDWSARFEGGKFRREWFQIVSSVPETKRSVRFWDLAGSAAKPGVDPDWTVGAKVGLLEDNSYVIQDIVRFRASPHEVERRMQAVALRDGGNVTIGMFQDPGQAGLAQVDHFRKDVLRGWVLHTMPTSGIKSGKETRGNIVSSAAEAGNIKLVNGMWILPFIEEAEVWPYGRHDDMIDAVGAAFDMLRTRRGGIGFVR